MTTGNTTMRHNDGDVWNDVGDGRQDNGRLEDIKGQHNDGWLNDDNRRHNGGNGWHNDGQQGDRWHNDGNERHDDAAKRR